MHHAPLIFALLVQFALSDSALAESRDSKHFLLPFLGYQAMNGEQVGYHLEYEFTDSIFTDSTYSIVKDGLFERNKNTPALGVAYRYVPNKWLFYQVALGVIHDGENIEYPVQYEAIFPTRTAVKVTRRNTITTEAGVVFSPRFPVEWVTPAVIVGGGYARREIGVKAKNPWEEVSTHDATELYFLKGGVDITIWRGKKFMIQGTAFYTQFYSMDNDTEPFGGVGWRLGLFPIWSAR